MAVTVNIEWSKQFTKSGGDAVDVKPMSEKDESFQRLSVDQLNDTQSSPAPSGASVAIVTPRNGDIVLRIDNPIGASCLGRLAMDGGPRILPVKEGQVLHMRAVPAYE